MGDDVGQLKAPLEEAKAAMAEKDRQLAEAKAAYEKGLREAEVTFATQRDEQMAAVKLECELDKLRDIEALRKKFDKEKQLWHQEKEEWAVWKTAAQSEKDELMLKIGELKKEKAHVSESGSGSERSSSSESDEDKGGVPASGDKEGSGEGRVPGESAAGAPG